MRLESYYNNIIYYIIYNKTNIKKYLLGIMKLKTGKL